MIDGELPAAEPLLYGVWVPGQGWLRGKGEAVFADARRPVAESAASFIPGSRVCVMDTDALRDLEKRFLTEEATIARTSSRQGWRALQTIVGNWLHRKPKEG